MGLEDPQSEGGSRCCIGDGWRTPIFPLTSFHILGGSAERAGGVTSRPLRLRTLGTLVHQGQSQIPFLLHRLDTGRPVRGRVRGERFLALEVPRAAPMPRESRGLRQR